MEAIIRTVNLCRDFSSGGEVVHALRDVNISINPGALTVLRGRSGREDYTDKSTRSFGPTY